MARVKGVSRAAELCSSDVGAIVRSHDRCDPGLSVRNEMLIRFAGAWYQLGWNAADRLRAGDPSQGEQRHEQRHRTLERSAARRSADRGYALTATRRAGGAPAATRSGA